MPQVGLVVVIQFMKVVIEKYKLNVKLRDEVDWFSPTSLEMDSRLQSSPNIVHRKVVGLHLEMCCLSRRLESILDILFRQIDSLYQSWKSLFR